MFGNKKLRYEYLRKQSCVTTTVVKEVIQNVDLVGEVMGQLMEYSKIAL